MTANRPHDVYTRRDYTKPWALEATFAAKDIANSYVWHLEETSQWEYEVRPATFGHIRYGFRLLGMFVVVLAVALAAISLMLGR